MRRETEKYEQSALKNFFDFALSDTVNDKYEEILTNQAEIQLGDLIANSPDIVEGWKQGDPAQRAYISNLNPIAQNLIEEKLSEQVANEYTGSVTAALAASPIMTSATATPEQLSAERARIMAESGSSTGYTSLSPYWIAQTASDISRVQSATEAKLDATRQKNKAAHNLTKYSYANAESYYQKTQALTAYAPQLTEEQTGQAYRAMSQEWEQGVRDGLEGALTTPSTHLTSAIEGIETKAEELIAAGEIDEAVQYLDAIQKMAASREIILENGVNYWAQKDTAGQSGFERLNKIAENIERRQDIELGNDATVWAEQQIAKGVPLEEQKRIGLKRFPGQQAEIIAANRTDQLGDSVLTDEQQRARLEWLANPGSTKEAALRYAEENDLIGAPNVVKELMGAVDGTLAPEAKEFNKEFETAAKSQQVELEALGIADALLRQVGQGNESAIQLVNSLTGSVTNNQTNRNYLASQLLRLAKTSAYADLEELQSSGALVDAEGNPVPLYTRGRELIIERLREQADMTKTPVETTVDPELDKNKDLKEQLKSYSSDLQSGNITLQTFSPEFIEKYTEMGVINDGMTDAAKITILSRQLKKEAQNAKLNGSAVFTPKQADQVIRGEIDPYTLQPVPMNESTPRRYRRGGDRRGRGYVRPVPVPEVNPFGEPPLPMYQFDGKGGGPVEEGEEVSSVGRFLGALEQIAGVTLDVTLGSPAHAGVENQEAIGDMAYIWTRRKPLEAGTPALPQINGNVVVKTVPIQMTTPRHPYFVAIGIAEGTRTPDGGFTRAWGGHIDPADGNYNRGTVSGGRGATRGMNAEQVDNYYMNELTSLALAAGPVFQQYGMKPNAQIWHRAMFNYLDLHIQAPVAARDFLRKIPEAIQAGGQIEHFAKIRADSFRDPVSGILYTSFSSYGDLLRDQRSRAGVFDYRKRL